MRQILIDIVSYANEETVSLLLKPSVNTLSPTQSILVAQRLLSWICGQAALRKLYPSKKDFRPMRISIPQPWHDDLHEFVAGNAAVLELFEVTSDTLGFHAK